jgi:hypothetical protein
VAGSAVWPRRLAERAAKQAAAASVRMVMPILRNIINIGNSTSSSRAKGGVGCAEV